MHVICCLWNSQIASLKAKNSTQDAQFPKFTSWLCCAYAPRCPDIEIVSLSMGSQRSGDVHEAHIAPVCAGGFWTGLDSWAREILAVFPHRCWVSGGKQYGFRLACRLNGIVQDAVPVHRDPLMENSQFLLLLSSFYFRWSLHLLWV